jgi:hypothetical protein
MNQSGTVYCYTSPNHDNVFAFSGSSGTNEPQVLSLPLLSTYAEVDVSPVSRDPCMISAYPIKETEFHLTPPSNGGTNGDTLALYPLSNAGYEFPTNNSGGVATYAINGTTLTGGCLGVPIAVVIISGLAAGASYHCEYITHVEYSGAIAGSLLTFNESDPQDLGVVATAAQRLPAAKMAQPRESLWSLMRDCLLFAGRTAAKFVVPAAEKMLTKLLL